MGTRINDLSRYLIFRVFAVLLAVLIQGSASAQTFTYTGSETSVPLQPGTYDITAYGAQGGSGYNSGGGLGAEMEAQFNFATATNLTILVGGSGYNGVVKAVEAVAAAVLLSMAVAHRWS